MANRIEIDIEVLDLSANPLVNNQKIKYQINKNFEPLFYDNGRSLVEKRFVVPDQISADRIASFDGGTHTDTFGYFNGEVNSIDTFIYKGNRYHAVGGSFTNYFYDNAYTNTAYFIILNEDGSPYKPFTMARPLVESSGSLVKAVKYHEVNETIMIGGSFDVKNTGLSDFVEFDIASEDISSRMSLFESRGGIGASNNGVTAIDIKQNTGTTVILGNFGTVLNNQAKGIFLFDADFDIASVEFYQKTKDILDLAGDFRTVLIRQSGTPNIYIGGSFTANVEVFIGDDSTFGVGSTFEIIVSNFLGLTVGGEYIDSFDRLDGDVYDIKEITGNLVIAGDINEYGINNPVKNLFYMSLSGSLRTSFDPNIDFGTVKSIKPLINVTGAGQITTYVYASFDGIPEYNFALINLNTEEITERTKFETTPNIISFDNTTLSTITDIIIGGGFTSFNFPITNTSSNGIVVNVQDAEIVRDNIYDNLIVYDTRSEDLGFKYSKVGNNIVRISKIIEGENDIYNLSDVVSISNKVTVSEFSNDGSLASFTDISPIRKDKVVENELGGGATGTRFIIGLIEDFLTGAEDTLEINKPILNSDINNNYLNISRLIPDNNLQPNLEYFLDMGRGLGVKNANHGKFYNVNIDSLIRNDVTSTSNIYFFALNGYKFTSNKAEDKILLNGHKRLLTREGTISIPFLSYHVDSIDIASEDINTTINQGSFGLSDATNPNEFVSYLTLNTGITFKNSNKITLTFNLDPLYLDSGQSTEYIMEIEVDNNNTVYNPTRVIFQNSYGIYEEVIFKGRYSNSIETNSESYKKSIYSYRKQNTKYGHLTTQYNKTPTREWVLNTGNTKEYMNGCFEDLVASEKVWIDVDGEVIAVEILERSFDNRLSYIEGVLNYQFDFKEAKDLTQNIV